MLFIDFRSDISSPTVCPLRDAGTRTVQEKGVIQKMKRVLMSATMLAAIASFMAVQAAVFSTDVKSEPPVAQQAAMIPINFSSALGSFQGVFDITRFAVQGGQLVAIGTISGVVRDALGNVIGNITDQALTLPVLIGATTGTCDILHLELGPLDLNLLGLVVHLDQVVLDITAEQGPGNLLGNLLCAVAGLLDRGGPLQAIAALLNQILRVLG